MAKPKTSIASRFWSKVQKTDGCWLWTAAKINSGYGLIDNKLAHRWSYEEQNGAIPAGLVIDHLCRNPACVNPRHLEAVTQSENLRRGHFPNSAKAACPRGHPYAGDNLFINHAGRRECRQCRNERNRNAKRIARLHRP